MLAGCNNFNEKIAKNYVRTEKRVTMGKDSFNTQQLLLLLAVVALVVGLVFHIMYLIKDRTVETAQDEYNKNNSLMFFGLAVSLGVVALVWGKQPRVTATVSV